MCTTRARSLERFSAANDKSVQLSTTFSIVSVPMAILPKSHCSANRKLKGLRPASFAALSHLSRSRSNGSGDPPGARCIFFRTWLAICRNLAIIAPQPTQSR